MFQTPFGVSYLRARGRFHLAMGSRRQAIEDFEACGELMTRWGLDLPGLAPWRADLAEARRDGEPEQPEDPAVDELSDAERRVAALAVQGHTNQQIARQLFITVSTVEQHLTRVYRKLRINSRSDLPFSLASGLHDTV
jgi:DNA-binding CsgD family transcriptional regulator